MRGRRPSGGGAPLRWLALVVVAAACIVCAAAPAEAGGVGAAALRQLLAPLDAAAPSTRIVGGTAVQTAERFPYIVSLRTADGSHFCGGELAAGLE